jgi:hypothetical protein
MKKPKYQFIQNLIGPNKMETLKKFLFEEDKKEDEEEEKMGSATLEDGTPIEWQGDLAVGTVVNVITEEGSIPAPAGSHVLSTGQTIVIEGDEGVISSIEEAAAEQEGELLAAVTELQKEIQASVTFNKQRFEAIEKENKLLKTSTSTLLEIVDKMTESMEVKIDRNDKFSRHEENAKQVHDKVNHLTQIMKKAQTK